LAIYPIQQTNYLIKYYFVKLSCRDSVGSDKGLGKNGGVKKHYNTFNLHLELRDQVG